MEREASAKCLAFAKSMHETGELLSIDIKNAFNSVSFEAIIAAL
jgi:hypothetical protein